jgi:zinc transporter, ZIP family
MTAFLVTLVAGLSTTLGAVLASKVKGKTFQSFSLAFATGIMLMISLGEMLPDAFDGIGTPLALVLMVAGAFLSLALDLLFPHHHDEEEEPGHYINECECSHSQTISHGMVAALILHNVIEGVATGVAVESDLRLGLSMALGIAIHNVPIGATLCVSLMSAGESRGKAIFNAVLVGLSQPLGAVLGLLVLTGSAAQSGLNACMALVAGILIFISFDELCPASRKNGSRNMTIVALLLGICFIPITEILLPF